MLKSFETGNANAVYQASVELVKAYRHLYHELAKLRYLNNFGTEICTDCDGLKAGPGVVATCFQVKACNFTNIKEDGVGNRHLRVLDNLLGGV